METTDKRFDWCYDKKLSENKSFEMQLTRWNIDNWFDFQIKWSRRADHCGPEISAEVLGWYFCAKIYDHRHWNLDENRFYFPGEEWEKLAEFEKQIGDRNFCGNSKFTITSNTKL